MWGPKSQQEREDDEVKLGIWLGEHESYHVRYKAKQLGYELDDPSHRKRDQDSTPATPDVVDRVFDKIPVKVYVILALICGVGLGFIGSDRGRNPEGFFLGMGIGAAIGAAILPLLRALLQWLIILIPVAIVVGIVLAMIAH
ncbi:hypothetical protein [Celerinatantimonas sp. YJH-8]|uniref:hypothetical protein n=1 Tax=Celerinatantimonas sp. YJH-8 TaxID=3228714 RepID=UPI0038C4C274